MPVSTMLSYMEKQVTPTPLNFAKTRRLGLCFNRTVLQAVEVGKD